MHKITSAAAVLVVGLFLAGLMTVPLGAASASTPDLKVGDRWAMGEEIDYGSNITANMDLINGYLQSYANLTIKEMDVDSDLAYYVLFEVTGENDTTYTVTAKMAVRFATVANIEITGAMPVAGDYGVSEDLFSPSSTVAKETKTMSLDLDEKMGMVLTATTILEKSTMAISNITWSYKGALTVDLNAKNIPDINTTETTRTIAYKNYDVGVEAVVGVNLYMDFAPSLDMLQLPIAQGEWWYTNASTVTISGNVNGHVDAHGLTDDLKAQIFTEELTNVTGATDFPISLDKLNTPNGEVTNGSFGPYTANLTGTSMYCSRNTESHVVDGKARQYYVIQAGNGERFLYSPDGGLFSGMSMSVDTDELNLPSSASAVMNFMGGQVDMEPMDADAASSNIKSIESYTDKLAAEANDKGFNVSDFFFKPPFLGILVVTIAAMSIAALALYAVKFRKP
jgi:hypothetical protein